MIKPHKDFSKAQSHLNKNRLYISKSIHLYRSINNIKQHKSERRGRNAVRDGEGLYLYV